MNFNHPDKILIILIGGIGDFVIGIPALKSLRNIFPQSKIVLLTSERVYPYASFCPWTDEVFSFPFSLTFKNLFKIPQIITKLHNKHFDIIINFYEIGSWFGSFKMFLLFFLIGGKYKVGRNTNGKGFFYNIKIKDKGEKSQGDYYQDIIKFFGGKINYKDKFAFWISERSKQNIEKFLLENKILPDDFLIGINPGSARKTRYWFPKRFAEVSDKLVEKYNAKIIILGGPGEEKLAFDIAYNMKKKPIIIAGKTSIEEVIVLIKKLKLLITTNSSLMHIANSLEIPFVCLIGPGDIIKDAPYMGNEEKYVLIQKKIPCIPCYKNKCKKMDCMKKIIVEDVLKAVEKLKI